MRKICLVLWILCFVMVGCSGIEMTEHAKKAEIFLKDKGYKIVKYKGNSSYELNSNNVKQLPYKKEWSVQTIQPDPFFNRKIHVQTFIIKNHPLDNYKGSKGNTTVRVLMVDGKIIGGTSLPNFIMEHDGGSYYSLDGRTIEDMD